MSTTDSVDTDRGSPLVDALADWLVSQSLRDTPLDRIYEGTCKQLYAAGIPVTRGQVAFRVLHPLFEAQALRWQKGGKIETANYLHGADKAEFERSPFFHMIENNVRYLRRHLVGDAAMLDFPILLELRDQGFTDYFGFAVWFDEHSDLGEMARGIIGSWSTDRKSGFTNADIRSLNRIEQRLAVAFKINIQSRITENILSAYLGPGAGARVLSGQIKRGDGEDIHAVIWYSDMRDSTRLADSMPGEAFLEALNQYFESTAGAVLQHGGEVLRFVGDAVLAIFPIRGRNGAEKACRRAMQAAATARGNLLLVNEKRLERGEERLDFGLGLHIGQVLFGNIGVPERVEFSVVGPAANEVARLESLTKSLKREILVSESFARHMKLDWISEGRHALRGVGQQVSVYTPP